MPVDAKPLFRPDALRPHLREYHWPDHLPLIREILTRWTGLVTGRSAEKLNEQEILADFLTDIFGTVLGYSRPVDNPDRYTFTRELQVFGKFADAALGVFRPTGQQYAVAIEGKGPLDPLDRGSQEIRSRSGLRLRDQPALRLDHRHFDEADPASLPDISKGETALFGAKLIIHSP